MGTFVHRYTEILSYVPGLRNNEKPLFVLVKQVCILVVTYLYYLSNLIIETPLPPITPLLLDFVRIRVCTYVRVCGKNVEVTCCLIEPKNVGTDLMSTTNTEKRLRKCRERKSESILW